jgi:hypothetical protein
MAAGVVTIVLSIVASMVAGYNRFLGARLVGGALLTIVGWFLSRYTD